MTTVSNAHVPSSRNPVSTKSCWRGYGVVPLPEQPWPGSQIGPQPVKGGEAALCREAAGYLDREGLEAAAARRASVVFCQSSSLRATVARAEARLKVEEDGKLALEMGYVPDLAAQLMRT